VYHKLDVIDHLLILMHYFVITSKQ